jgi:copper(I)-binding protein
MISGFPTDRSDEQMIGYFVPRHAKEMRLAAACLGLLVLPWCASFAAAEIVLKEAWIREAPPNVGALAGYFVLQNDGDHRLILQTASSEEFERIEFHQTEVTEGVARMKRLETVEINPGGRVTFEPGGAHLMLMGPRRALKAGDMVEVSLEFEGGVVVGGQFAVRRP